MRAALDAVCDALEDAGSTTLAAVAAAIAEEPVLLRVTVAADDDERTVELPRAALQRAAEA